MFYVICVPHINLKKRRGPKGLAFLPVFLGSFVITVVAKLKQGVCHAAALPFTLKSIFRCGKTKTRGASCCGLAIYIKKYLQAKKKALWNLKYFTMQKYNRQKIL
jgi:hypothetical protein